MTRASRPRLGATWLAPTMALVVVVALGLVASRFWLFLLTSMVITALLARSVGIVFGRASMVSLCQASFAGIGGWIVGSLTLSAGVPFTLALVIAGLAVVPVGVVVGLPALRLRGVNLAVVTLGFATAASVLIFNRGFPTGGSSQAVPRPALFAGERSYFFFALAVGVLVEAGLRWIGRRRIGTSWSAVGHSERTTAALGLSVSRTKLSAFAVSAFVAAVAGGLMAGQVGFLSGRSFEPMASLVVFAVAVATGAQFLAGALLAGGLSVGIPELLRIFDWPQDIAPLLFAVAAIQALSVGRGGIAAQWQAQLTKRRGPAASHGEQPESTPPPTIAPPESVLRCEDVTVTYGRVTAVDAVSLELQPGTVHGLVGPNGAGKSSLIDALTGFTHATGEVRLGDKTVSRLPAHERARSGIRRTFQRERTIPELRVGQYVRLAAGRVVDADEIAWLVATLALPAPGTPISSIDAGARRRLEIAGAAAAHPSALLLDEPAAGLTDDESRLLGVAIRQLAATCGFSVLLIEHDIPLVRSACDTVSILDRGRLIATGSPAEVFADAAVMTAYLGVMPEEPTS